MSGALQNKNEYLNYMIDKYADMVYRIALTRTNNKLDSEDIFQEVFLRITKKCQFLRMNNMKRRG